MAAQGAKSKSKSSSFEKESEVRLEGATPEIETASGSKRENLPDKVEPNKTYRDVHVRWGAAARLRAPERGDRA